MPEATSAQDIFDNLPRFFDPEKAAGLNASIQFELSGEGGGIWNVVIADQTLKASEGTLESPTLTLMTAAADWVAIINGDLNPMAAFMQGKMKLSGDMSLAMKLQSLFSRPE